MKNRKVKDIMTEQPVFINPSATLKEAAQRMTAVDCGFLPVGTQDNVQGIITDRDIVTRAISNGKDPSKEKVCDYMTGHAYGCREADYLEDAAEKMRLNKVSRLVVRDPKGQVTGVLSFGRILRKTADPVDVANVVKHAIPRIAA